jgi:hypothetical protein
MKKEEKKIHNKKKYITFGEKYRVNPGIEDGDIEPGTYFFSRSTTSITRELLSPIDTFLQKL